MLDYCFSQPFHSQVQRCSLTEENGYWPIHFDPWQIDVTAFLLPDSPFQTALDNCVSIFVCVRICLWWCGGRGLNILHSVSL